MSLISGKYWAGDPSIKPEAWGPIEDVEYRIKDYFNNVIGCASPEFFNPFWTNAGLNFPSVIGSNFNYRRGNPTWRHNRLYLNDNGHGTTNDEIDSVGTWDGVAGDKTFIFLTKQIGVAYPNNIGSTLFQNYSGTFVGRVKISVDGSLNKHFFQLGNNVGHKHEVISDIEINYGDSYLVAMRGDYSNNTGRCTVNGTHKNLVQVSSGWAGSTPEYYNDFILGAYKPTDYPYYGADCEYDIFAYIPDYLTDNQMDKVYDNPYAQLKPIIRRSYFIPNVYISLFSCYDTGTVSENISINVGATISDTGAGSDMQGMGADVPVFDSCAGIDVVGTSISVAVVDGAGAVDIVSNVLNSLSVSDVAAAIDSVSQVIATAIINDGAVGEETVNTSVLGSIIKTVYDTAAGQDVLGGPVVSFSLSDSAAGADLVASISNALSVSDVVSANELASVIKEKLINISESASGVDALSLSVALTVSEVSTAIETLGQILNAININDAGLGTDTAIATNLDMLPSGKVTITFSMRIPGADFTIDFPGADFTIN